MPNTQESEYRLDFFKIQGYSRKVCTSCGTPFWTKGNNTHCADIPCTEYYFFDLPIASPRLSVREARNKFISFFASRGHTPIPPKPVLARWREDLYLTIASIVDFQPHITSGISPPPANPLVVSQPCIRLDDVDNVGITFGRHLTTFEMAAHHAFNSPDKQIYWKDETVRLAKEFFTEEIEVPEEQLNFKESWWEGGGNAGPCFEVTVGGLEVATLVFMQYSINGEKYEPLQLKIVDTGYGVERIAWLTQKSPTAFHVIYGDLVPSFFKRLGIPEPEAEVLKTASVLAGKIDPDHWETVKKHRIEVASRTGLSVNEVESQLTRAARVFQVLDHSKTLALMLGDGMVPSNSGEGYLGRLVLRRALKVLKLLGSDARLSELLKKQVEFWGEDFPQMKRNLTYILEVAEDEQRKFEEILSKIPTVALSLSKKGKIGEGELITLYDSQGIPPDILSKELDKYGVKVNVPENFYAVLAKKHQSAPLRGGKEQRSPKELGELVKDLSKTEKLYYQDQYRRETEATVLLSKGEYLVLDRTVFYPQGGGQLGDQGTVVGNYGEARVADTQDVKGVVVHILEGERRFTEGQKVEAKIDWKRRYRLMRHHTATHVVLAAAKRVLGEHVWQAGAEKTPEKGRLDITHHRMPTKEEVRKIEELANNVILDRRVVRSMTMTRTEAESKFGVNIYEGGVPITKDIRLIEIENWDVEACGGTHVLNTGEIGGIKIVNVEKIQDGVVRLEFVAGDQVSNYATSLEENLDQISSLLGSKGGQLVDRLRRRLDEAERREELLKRYRTAYEQLLLESVRWIEADGVRISVLDQLFDEEVAKRVMRRLTEVKGTIVVRLDEDMVQIATSRDLDVGPIVSKLLKVGGKGGGKGTMATVSLKIDKVTAERLVREALKDNEK